MGIGIVAVLLAEWVAALARYESEQLDQSDETFMRKRLITAAAQVGVRTDRDSLDLGTLATAEVTPETKDHPLESALLKRDLRVACRSARNSDHPLTVRRFSLVFEETAKACTQEFVLR